LKNIILILIILSFQSGLARAEDEKDVLFRDVAYPENKFYEDSYKVMEKQHEILDGLYMKTPKIKENVNLREIDAAFFSKGTMDKKPEDYLKETEQERWEEWSPFFYEFGKVLKQKSKQIFHDWLSSEKTKLKREKIK